MRVEPDAVEQDYRREERREHKAMESELPGAKFNTNTLNRAVDDNRSVGSGKSQKPLSAALFFQKQVIRRNNAAIEKLEDLLEKHQGTDGEEASAAMATVQEVL